jgi:hypothetical protein
MAGNGNVTKIKINRISPLVNRPTTNPLGPSLYIPSIVIVILINTSLNHLTKYLKIYGKDKQKRIRIIRAKPVNNNELRR